MKKVRNLLILLLAALMLTVFTSCDPNANNSGNNGSNEGSGEITSEDKLVISKFFIGPDDKNDLPNGYDPADYNTKFFAITNTGESDIDLSQYGMAYEGKDKNKKDVQYITIFPSATLKPNATLYIVNSYNKANLFLYNMLPNIQTLPKIDDTPIITNEALFESTDVRFKKSTFALQLATNIDISDPENKTWTTIDTVKLPSGDLDAKALIRNEDLTWTSLDWLTDKTELTKIDSKKGSVEVVRPDYSFAKFKADIIDAETPSTDIPFSCMSYDEFGVFKNAAIEAGCVDATRDRYDYSISVEYEAGTYATITLRNEISKADYSFATLSPHIDAYIKNPKYKMPTTKYCEMPYIQRQKFVNEVSAAHETWLASASNKGLEITTDNKKIKQNDAGEWTIEDYVNLPTIEGNGDLVITRTYRNIQNKFLAFTNTNATATDLSLYKIIITINNEDTLFSFPTDTKLEPGKSIFLLSSNSGCSGLPKLKALPKIENGKTNGNCQINVDMNSWNNKDGDSVRIMKGDDVVQGIDAKAISGNRHTKKYAEGKAAETADWVEFKGASAERNDHFDDADFWINSKPAETGK